MSRPLVSLWDQMQLRLLRLLSIALALVDGLLGVSWGEQLLDRLASRWQDHLAEIDAALAALEEERTRLHLQAEGLALYAAVTYLASRQMARGELCFDPADPDEEQALEANIDLLVKERLAAVEISPVGSGHDLYRLEPDWAQIQARLEQAASQADPEAAGWLRDGASLIEELC
jgi:hypothetical protein